MENEKTVEGKVINSSPLPQKAKEPILGEEPAVKDATTSPILTADKSDGMDFLGAMKSILDGEKVTRMAWGNKEIYCVRESGFLMIRRDGEFHQWILSDEDMESTDWVSVL